ncbi:MAG: glycosyltransferase [Rhodanobacter sp.]|jgi:glycosyltransferase involved in cell wall biosynthesis|nr:glycosyltransferase [Rhodanobacter sp.]
MKVVLLGPVNVIHTQRWVEGLNSHGVEVVLVTQHDESSWYPPSSVRMVRLPYQGTVGYFLNVMALRRLLRIEQPDLLNVHYASGYGTTAALAGFHPWLLSVWGSDVYDFPYENSVKRFLIRFNLHKASAIASTSHAMAGQVRRLTPDVNQIMITPFGIDISNFRPEPWRKDSSWITVGIVKTLALKYGVDLLLRAFAGLRVDPRITALPQACRLMIVGDGPQRRELEVLAGELGIADRTYFAGSIPHAEVPDWLNKFDIYCAPSRLESFGVAVIEAGACELPVVVSDVGGLPEVVRGGETGLIVPRENVEELQMALAALVLNADLRKKLGRRGREHVAGIYDWQSSIVIMKGAYAATIEKYNKSRR